MSDRPTRSNHPHPVFAPEQRALGQADSCLTAVSPQPPAAPTERAACRSPRSPVVASCPPPPAARRERPAYRSPEVVRVRIETTRLRLGQIDAVSFCTIHDHDIGFNTCTKKQ